MILTPLPLPGPPQKYFDIDLALRNRITERHEGIQDDISGIYNKTPFYKKHIISRLFDQN